MKGKLYCMLLMAFAILSCSPGSEEDYEIKNEIDETQKPFAGGWHTSDSAVWILRPDGVCMFCEWKKVSMGEWQYNPTTSILATTIDSYSWQVTIVTENAWSGITFDSDKTAQSFTRLPDSDLAKYAIEGTWKTKDMEVTFLPFYGDEDVSGNIYKEANMDSFFWDYEEEGDKYDGICLVGNRYYRRSSNPNWDDKTYTLSIDTMIMSMENGWMDKFVYKSSIDTDSINTFTRVIPK